RTPGNGVFRDIYEVLPGHYLSFADIAVAVMGVLVLSDWINRAVTLELMIDEMNIDKAIAVISAGYVTRFLLFLFSFLIFLPPSFFTISIFSYKNKNFMTNL
ncbi:MAG: hypothetical protein KHZ62_11545, partial [Clostridiales bacterium]|nr:hypothetical protein [Clostridiales bacterium]